MDTFEVRVVLLEGADSAAEHHDEEGQAEEEEGHLRKHPAAHEDECRDTGVEDREIDEQHEVEEHRAHGANGVDELHVLPLLALLGEELIDAGADREAVYDWLEAEHGD